MEEARKDVRKDSKNYGGSRLRLGSAARAPERGREFVSLVCRVSHRHARAAIQTEAHSNETNNHSQYATMDPDQVTSAEETRAISPPNNGMKRERSASDDEEERRVLQRKDTSWTESNDIKTNVKAMVRLNSKTILTQIMVKMRTTLRQPIPDDHQVFHRVGGVSCCRDCNGKVP